MLQFDKIKLSTAVTILSCVVPFFEIIFMFFLLNRKLFISVDTIKLCGIGIGLTAPILLSNFIIALRSESSPKKPQQKDQTEQSKDDWAYAGFLSMVFISFFTLIGFKFNFPLVKTIEYLALTEISIIILTFVPFKNVGAEKK